jgi:hypothetical protein
MALLVTMNGLLFVQRKKASLNAENVLSKILLNLILPLLQSI